MNIFKLSNINVESHGFPQDISTLKKVKNLGGSTGAILMEDPKTGSMYVAKQGNHADHARTEYDINKFLKGLGVTVPDAKMYKQDGKPVILTRFIPAKTLREYLYEFPDDKNVINKIRSGYVPQALIANWDVFGMNQDNVLIDEIGEPHYVDVGGSGPYRAQGDKKGDKWNDQANELRSMRRKLYDGITDDEIRGQIKSIAPLVNPSLQNVSNPQLRDMLKRRYDSMSRF